MRLPPRRGSIARAITAPVRASPAAGSAGAVLTATAPPLHMFRQLRGAYQLGWVAALWRTAALLIISGLALIVWLILLAIGAS